MKRASSKGKKQLHEWIAEFESARKRSFSQHINNSFIHTYKPVLDDTPYRTFRSMKEYRKWCEKKLPKWLGYGKTL